MEHRCTERITAVCGPQGEKCRGALPGCSRKSRPLAGRECACGKPTSGAPYSKKYVFDRCPYKLAAAPPCFPRGGRLSAALPAPPPPRFPCPAAARPTGSRRPPLGIKGKETYLTGETLPAVSGARKKNSAPPCFPREAVVPRSYCDAAPYHIRRIFCAAPG